MPEGDLSICGNLLRGYSITSSARSGTDCRNGEPKRRRGHVINDQFEFGRLLHWQISGLGTFKDVVHVGRCAPLQIYDAAPLGH